MPANTAAASARVQNREKRNARIREAFRQQFTDAPRPRKHSREYVLAQLADDFCLAIATVEDIVYQTSTHLSPKS